MTLQQRDILTFNEKEYALNCDIMKPYFAAYPERKPAKTGFDSSLHRGYFSEFSIVDNRLLVNDLRVYTGFDKKTGEQISISVAEPALSNITFCHWFSGQLLLFSLENEPENDCEFLQINVNEGIVVDFKTISEQEYHDFENHAYDYF